MTIDRLSSGYVPDFDIDRIAGLQGELWVLDIIRALGTDAVEVKTDDRYRQTGNLYVEFEQNARNRGVWKPSGIATTKAEVWVFKLGDSPAALVIATDLLREWCSTGLRTQVGGATGDNPTRGYLLPMARVWAHLREVVS